MENKIEPVYYCLSTGTFVDEMPTHTPYLTIKRCSHTLYDTITEVTPSSDEDICWHNRLTHRLHVSEDEKIAISLFINKDKKFLDYVQG